MSNETSKEEKKKRIILIGRSTAGKTTLCQRINNEELHYYKTQTVQVINKNMIDTPGEYLERRGFRGALIVTSADADIILMVQDATEGGTMFPPLFCSMFAGKPCVGIITKADLADEEQIERAKKLLESKDPEEIKKGPNDVRRFLKRTAKTKSGERAAVEYTLDEDKIAEEEKYDGYYAVATNLADSVKDILAVSQKRYQIEDCFRIMKTNFNGRPVNHRLSERIRAHFLICYTALLVYRLLEVRLDDQKTHVTPNDLITTLKNMNVTNVHDIEYMALYKGSKALDALTQLTMLPLDRCHYRPKDLNKLIKKISK